MQITKEQIIEIFQKNSIEHLFPLGGYVATVSKEHWIDVADEILTLLQSNDAGQPNASKPLVVSSAYMVLMGKESKNVFWTKGGEYDPDEFDMLFESDSEDEAMEYWRMKMYVW